MRYSFKAVLIQCYKWFWAGIDETPQMSYETLVTKINLIACVQAGVCVSWKKASKFETLAYNSPLDEHLFQWVSTFHFLFK